MSSTKRYFRNKADGEKKKDQQPSSTEKLQGQLFTSSTEGTALARQYLDICCGACEHPNEHGSTSSKSMGTLYHGDLGSRVLLRLRMAQHLRLASPKEEKLEIQALLEHALALAEQGVRVETQRLQKHRLRVTLLEGPYVGAKALLAAIHFQLDHIPKAKKEASKLIQFLDQKTQNMPFNECEVLYGRAGALQAILFLRKEFQNDTLGSPVALRLAQEIIREGQRLAAKAKQHNLPLLWEWHDKQYLGAAHGVVGILHILLGLQLSELQRIQTANNTDLPSLLQQTIQALDDLCWPESGNLKSSIPTGSRGEDKLVHWCHGAPGHVLLLVKAHEVFGNVSYLERARQIGEQVLWPRGLLRKGVGLCHGIAGNAYCFLALARNNITTSTDKASADAAADNESNKWRNRACYYAAFANEHWADLENVPDQPYSVYVGAGGLALLLMDLGALVATPGENTEQVRDSCKFPLYDF